MAMLKWWGVRHVRWLYYSWRVQRWATLWGDAGVGLGDPNKSDLFALDMIWKGKR